MKHDGIGMTPVLQEPRRKATKKSKKIYFLSSNPANPHQDIKLNQLFSGFAGNGTKSSPLVSVESVFNFSAATEERLGIYSSNDDYVIRFFAMLKTSDSIMVPHETVAYYEDGAKYVTVSLIETEATYHISLVDSQDGVISYLNPRRSTSEDHLDRYIAGLNGANPTEQSLYDFIVNDPQLAKQVDSSNVASVSKYPLLDTETREVDGKDVLVPTFPRVSDFVGSGLTKDQFVRKIDTLLYQ